MLTIRATRHGPVLSDVNGDLADFAGPGKAVALAFTGLGDRDTTCAIAGGVVAAAGTAVPTNWLAAREPLGVDPR